MPRYYALDTAIKLSVWDPQAGSDLTFVNDRGSGTSNASVATASAKHNILPCRNKIEAGPATGYIVDDLKEEYFKGYEGVDFVAQGMPFYLVKAGRELFAVDEGENDVGRQFSPRAAGATQTTAPATVLGNNILDPAQSSQTKLSSIETELFTASEGSFAASKQDESSIQLEASGEPTTLSLGSPKAQQELQSEGVAKPITSPKPIIVTVDLSSKSFIPSIYTNQRQEICITIFYNGEFTHSRTLRGNTLNSLTGPVHDEKYQHYSGRRIDSVFEVPWVVRPHSAIAVTEVESLGFNERWNKTNELLLREANEWGFYDNFRSPMGEYLEELSKRAVPECIKATAGGGRAGIIDVVITSGKSVAAGAICGLREPRRKLHAAHCGKNRQLIIAPEELRPSKKAKIIREFNNETSRPASSPYSITESRRGMKGLIRKDGGSTRSTNAAMNGRGVSGKRPGYTVSQTATGQTLSNSSVPDDHNSNGCSKSFPRFMDVSRHQVSYLLTAKGATVPSIRATQISPPSQLRRYSLPELSSSPLSHYSNLPKSFPAPMTPVLEHPRKPKNIPQKRYKDAEYPESGPSVKRQKLLNSLENVPSDPEKPVSAFTRSRRAVSSPAAPSPEKFSSVAHESLPLSGDHGIPSPKTTIDSEAGLSVLIPNNGTEVIAGNEYGANLSPANPSSNPGQETAENSNPAPQNPGSVNSSPDLVEMTQASTPTTIRRLFSVAELTALESGKSTHGLKSDSHTSSHSMPFHMDGTADEPGCQSEQRSPTGSSRSTLSLPGTGSVAEPPASSLDQFPPQNLTQMILTPKQFTRIVFNIRGNAASSAVVNRKKFESLRLSGFAIGSTMQEMQKSSRKKNGTEQKAKTTPWVQTDNYMTENHLSARTHREAEATSQRARVSTQIAVESSASSTNKPPSKRQRKTAPPDNSINSKPHVDMAAISSEIHARKLLTGRKALHLPRTGANIQSVGGNSVGPTSAIASEIGPVGRKNIVPTLLGTVEGTSMEGKTVETLQLQSKTKICAMGSKIIFSPPTQSTLDMDSTGGKIIFLPPAPPYKPKRCKANSTGSATIVNNSSQAQGHVETPTTTKTMLKRNSVSSTKKSNETTEALEKVEALPNTQQKPNRNSISYRKRGNIKSEGADHSETRPRTYPKPKRDSVFSANGGMLAGADTFETSLKTQSKRKKEPVILRELEDLLPPHEGASRVDTLFGSSFKEASKKAQSSRNLKPIYAPPGAADLAANSTEGGIEVASMTKSANDRIVAASQTPPRKTPVFSALHASSPRTAKQQVNNAVVTSHESILSSKTPIVPNLLKNSSGMNEGQIDNMTARLIQDAIHIETLSIAASSQIQHLDMAKSKLPKTHVWPVAVPPIPSPQAENQRSNKMNLNPAEEVATEDSLPASQANGIPSQATLARRPSRHYSVDSEGKKIPTPRMDSLQDSAAPSQIQLERALIPKRQHDSQAQIQSSLSQTAPQLLKKPTVPRKLPITITPRQNSDSPGVASAVETHLNPKISVSDAITLSTPGSSTTPRRNLRATTRSQLAANSGSGNETVPTSVNPKMSVSETIIFSSSAKATQTHPSINTPASQSKSGTKRKDAEIASPSGDSRSGSTRLWKPNYMCDNSVLTYASNEIWPGTSIDPALKRVCRRINAEREGVFRASGVLMGVRFVVGLL